jgi:multidrug resistance efflux pump
MARQDRRLADLNLDPAQARDIALLERQLHDRRLLLAQTENYIAIYQREIERIQLDIETLKLQKQHRVTRADMIGRLYKVGAATPLEYRGEIALASGVEDMMVDAEQDIQVAEENIRYIRERAVLLEREMASLTNQIASQKAREAEADKELVTRIKAILEQAAKPPAERAKGFSEELARVYQLALQYAPVFQARIAIIDSEIARYQRDIVNASGREDVLKLRIRQQENNIRLLTEEQAYLGREYERARRLIASNAISRDEYLSYQASCAIIAKRVESARKELARMNEELRAITEKEIPELENMVSALGEKRKAYQNDTDKLSEYITQLRTALGQVTPIQRRGPAYLSAILATSSLRARDLASLQARLFDCELRLAQAPNRIAALERSIERANFESEALRIDSARKGSRLEMLRKLLASRAASASEYSAALAEFNKAQILVNSARMNVDILRCEIETVKAESDLLEKEVASLTSQIDSQKAREADAAKELEARIRSILEQAAKPLAERPQGFSEEATLVYQLILQYAPAFQARIAIIDSEIARYQRDLLNARGREEVLKLRIRQQEYNISMLTEQQNLRMQAYERAKRLMVSRAVSREEYEMDQAAYEIARQRVAAAKKELARLNEDLTAVTKKEIPRLEDMVRSLKERRERGATEYAPDKLNEYLAQLRAALGQAPAAPRPDTVYLSILLATSALRTRDLTALEDRLFSSRLALAQAPGRIAALERSIERVNFEVRALQSELEQKRQILQMYTKLRASNAVSTEEYEIKLADVRSTEALLQSLRMNAEILRSQIGTIRSESALIENEIQSLTRQIDAEKERVTTERARNVEEEERARQRTYCVDIDAALANLSWVDNYMPGTTQAERSVREGFKQSVAEVLFLADPDAVSSLSPIFMTPDGRLETAEQKKNVAKLFSILKNLNVLSGVLSKNPYYSGRGVTDGIKISIATDLIKKGEASDWATIFNLDGTLRGATAEERSALLRRLESIFHDAALLHSSLVSNRIENVRAWGIAMALATNPDRLTSWRANGMFLQGGFELSPRALKVFAKADALRPAFMADDLLTEMEAEGIAMSLAMEQGDDKGLSYWQKNSLVVEERGTYRLTEKGKRLIMIYKMLNTSPIKTSIAGNQDHKSGVLMAIAMDLVINGEGSGWALYLDHATGNIKGRNENETTSNREAAIKIFRIAQKIKDQGIVALQGDTPESQGNMIAIAMDLVKGGDNSAWAPYFNMDGTVRGTTGAEKAANRDDVQEIFNIVNGKPNKYTNEILTNEQVAILTGSRRYYHRRQDLAGFKPPSVP